MQSIKFNYLLGVSLLLYLLVNVFSLVSWNYLNDDVKKLMRFDGYSSPLEVFGLYMWMIFFILNLTSYLGMFLNKKWAGILFLLLHIVVFLLSFVGGVRVFHGVEYALLSLSLILDGIIIFMLLERYKYLGLKV